MKNMLRLIRRLLLGVSVLCLCGICFLAYEQSQADAVIQELRGQVRPPERTKAPPDESAGEADPPAELSFPAALREENPDLAAWLSVPGTRIDDPVMLTPAEPEFYLHRDFKKEYALAGTPFLDGRCAPAETADSLIAYGHNMRDGTMFSGLKSYEDEAFCRENPSIVLALPEQTRTYQVCAVVRLRTDRDADYSLYDCVGALTQPQFEAYAARLRDRSLYDTGVQPVYGDKLILLSTCSYHARSGRLAVVGCWQGAESTPAEGGA